MDSNAFWTLLNQLIIVLMAIILLTGFLYIYMEHNEKDR